MDNLFFWTSKLVWLFVSPASLLFMWLGAGVVLLWMKKEKWAKAILTCLAMSIFLLGLFPVGEWILIPLENRYPPNPSLESVDGIIVLAGAEDALLTSVWDQVVLSESAERDLSFMMLARQFPEAQLVFSGGTGSLLNQQYKAADAAERLFSEQGLDTARIIFERGSRNTYESALLSKGLVNPEPGQRWVLITTGWHMPRSMGIFCRIGWTVTPYPVDFQTRGVNNFRIDWGFSLRLISIGVKEWLGLTVYRLTGRSC